MAIAGVNISHELTNIPIGDMISHLAMAIADAQWELDKSSMVVTEIMSGNRPLRDFKSGEYLNVDRVKSNNPVEVPVLIDSRVYFGFDYTADDDGLPTRVPAKVSMLELGFTPTFYQFVNTMLEVNLDITLRTGTESALENKGKVTDTTTTTTETTTERTHHFFGIGIHTTERSRRDDVQVQTTPIDARRSSKYNVDATGHSMVRTKLNPTPPPSLLEERIRMIMEEERKWQSLLREHAPDFKNRDSGCYFNGATTQLELPKLKSLLVDAKSFTADFLFRAAEVPVQDVPLLAAGRQGRGMGLHYVLRQQKPWMGFYWGDSAAAQVILPEVWYHLAFTYRHDAPAETDPRTIFLNGVKLNDTLAHRADLKQARVLDDAAYESPLTVGGAVSWLRGSRSFQGLIDEVRIWNSALTEQEVLGWKFKKVSSIGSPASTNLVGCWDLSSKPDGSTDSAAVIRNSFGKASKKNQATLRNPTWTGSST